MPKLTTRKVLSEKKPGMHCDGEGLYLRVSKTGGKSWILRTLVFGRRRDFGLGSASLVGLAEARELSRELRKIARSGGDPTIARNRETISFEEAARRTHHNLLPTWRSKRHADNWLSAIERYAFPHFGERPIETVGTADLMNALLPIWIKKHDTATRVKQRLTTIFDWAKGAGYYPHENPANGLKKALPAVRSIRTHMASLPWQDLPKFMTELSQREAISALALQFIILTAARSGEVRGASWIEIKGDVWTVPANRMKTGKEHRVPLSSEALDILNRVKGLDSSLIFPSPNSVHTVEPKPLSDTVFKALMDRMNRNGLTTHGFRSTFRIWCSESAHVDREVAESALSHSIGNKVERAYARSDLLERRRSLMKAWAQYSAGTNSNVVQLLNQ